MQYLYKYRIGNNINNTLKILNHLKRDLPLIIKDINNIVKEKTKEYHDYYSKEGSKKLKIEISNIEKNIKKVKNDISRCLYIIKNKEIQGQEILVDNINEFESLMKNKNYYFNFTSQKEIIYYKLTIKAELKNKKKYIMNIKNRNNKYEKIEFDYNSKIIYLQSSVFDYNDIQDFFIFMKGDDTKKLNIKNKVDIEQCSIYKFDTSININDDIRERIIEDAKKSIKLYEPKITFNGNEFKKDKFDNLIKLIENLEINKYDKKHKIKIMNVINEIEEIDKYLNLETSNGRENDSKLEQKIRELKNDLSNLKDNLKLNLNDIEDIISFNTKIDNEKIFIKNHDKQIILYEEPSEDKPIYISNNSYLNYPMISDNGKTIIFSYKSFQMFLGSYIPSIISSPLAIKLLNIKKNYIKGIITECNTNIVYIDEIDNENTLIIYLNIQNLKSNELSKANINFKLELKSESYKELLIPFNLSLNIVPLSILFNSIDFKLNYDSENNIFYFGTSSLFGNSTIQFSFNYLYISENMNQLNNNTVIFDYSLDSLENNTSNKPILVKEKNKLIIKIPNYENEENNTLNFMLNIYFTSTFFINIKFNSKIYPLKFDFEWYSYNKKTFIDDDIIIYIEKDIIPYEYILFLKVKTIPDIYVQLNYNLPEGIEIISGNFNEKKIKNDEFIFPIKLKINHIPQELKNNDYYIKVTGNQISKKLYFFPKIINKKTNILEELLDLPKYEYSSQNNKFIKKSATHKDSIYITPFNYYIPFTNNLYPSFVL